MATLTPVPSLADTIKEMAAAGEQKSNLRLPQLIILGALAGVYLGFATALTTAVSASVPLPSLQKAVMGAVFPVGLIAIVIGGAALFTGNAMVLPVAAMVGRVRWPACTGPASSLAPATVTNGRRCWRRRSRRRRRCLSGRPSGVVWAASGWSISPTGWPGV